MYMCILIVTLFINISLQYKCKMENTNIKHQAFLMPFNKAECKESEHKETIPINTDCVKNQSNIKAKKIHITILLKRNNQVPI